MQLSPRLRWKIERYRRSLAEWAESLRSLAKASMVKQKVCPACRALVGARESRCPFCNEGLSAFHRVGVKRLMADLLPEESRYTTLLLGANFLLFAVSLLATMRAGVSLESLFSVRSGLPGGILAELGARDYRVANGEWWRLVTAMFLHGGFIHLLFNSWVLYDVGPAVEEMYGAARFLVLYFVSGVAGSLASFFWHPYVIMVGASGALFGLIGVMIAYGYRHRTTLAQQVRTMYVRWAVYGLVFGFMLRADNAAHLGGLAAGFVYGMLVSDTPSFTRGSILAWRVASYAALLAIALSFLMVGLRYGRPA